MNLTRQSLCSLMLALSPLTEAEEHVPPAPRHLEQEAWTVEAPYPQSTFITARINGTAAHADKTSLAILHVACYRSPMRPMIFLSTYTDQLHFDPSIYEGPDARSAGPLTLTTGTFRPRAYRINGYYSAEPTYDRGVLFKLTMSANRQELRKWIAEDMRGQRIKIKLPSAIPGDPPLTAEFVLPYDSSGLREAIKPCLNTQENNPKAPA